MLKDISTKEIRESPVALRQVDTQSEGFINLVDSIRVRGLMNPISVREKEVDGSTVYYLVDGLHRFTACKEVGFDEIPCNVLNVSDSEVLAAQIMANVHKIETKPVEYSKQITKILAASPLLTTSELATQLAKSPAWLNERLGLLKLIDRAQILVDEDKIGLSNAYAMAKLPTEEQADWVDRAMTDTPQEFMPAVNARVKQIRDERRKGRDAAPAEFIPVPRLRKLKEIKEEIESSDFAKAKGLDPTVFKSSLEWVLHLDADSISAAKAKDEERKKLRDDAAERRRVERLDKRAEVAADEAAKAKSETTAAKK